MRRLFVTLILTCVIPCSVRAGSGDSVPSDAPDPATVREAIRRAASFFWKHVSAHGGYVWRYSADLSIHEGEAAAGPHTAWVQPPGTPTVGMAYLEGYRLTGEPVLLQAARDAGIALVRGQLRSGGWTYRIEFSPDARKRFAYREDPERPRAFNVSTLDDDTTQSALRFLMQLDKVLGFKDGRIHDAVSYGLDRLLAAQYPHGAWPQGFDRPPDPELFPVIPARYPEEWSRTWPGYKEYWRFYTLNDNVLVDTIRTLLLAWDVYEEERFRAAALKGGDFILLAQMPEPQPAWAQQYDFAMHPAWARRFEPPAITGGESQGVLFMLLDLYERTGDARFLEPVPRALSYLKRSLLPDGRLARFYELRTNRPLYFNRQYVLTYDDSDLPTHYAFKVASRLDDIERRYRVLVERGPDRRGRREASTPKLTDSLVDRCKRVLKALDERGAWVQRGELRTARVKDVEVIESRTFAENLLVLCRYVAATESRQRGSD